ncbi:uncharacterized protein BO97DRAFT_429809 [Aspergillus homomorphus CBS 101889]|uniref:Uncharacterized protein n=1 Tax=Aspergillus homomorphus (strain CBS 101889) TaxID=1450537 RepID=A0A395HG46_ASPHC|nr:hypothetical protein BO97DRAFT_429809 [Aspergillus homomorphus CBS 101889]RAL06901.1 hypothetical protein BO97DRAFT_429809 [Aspergillus homomorphus CBS 101889]
MQIPMEIYDQIVFFVANQNSGRLSHQQANRHYSVPTSGAARQELATLCLVNQNFCRSASFALFRHIVARFHGFRECRTCQLLEELSCSVYASCVRQIDFKIHPAEDLSYMLNDLQYVLDLADAFFHLPSKIHKEICVQRVLMALHNIQLPDLTELHVNFPLAHQFEQFFSTTFPPSRTSEILHRLHHLGLCVSAFTNTDDLRRFASDVQASILPKHEALPNANHNAHLFQMVNLAPNLKSLALRSEDMLPLDALVFPPSLRLRSLSLRRMCLSSEVPIAWITGFKPTLRDLILEWVGLQSATWREVLQTIASAEIKTRSPHDWPALGVLRQQVNRNRIVEGLRPLVSTPTGHKPHLHRKLMARMSRRI